MMEVDGTR